MSSRSSTTRSQEGACEWRSATDQKSGRIYYYNIRTKETTWNKPLDLATPEERQQMIAKREETLQFFREMEHNIKAKIARALEEEERRNNRANGSPDFKHTVSFDETGPRDVIYYQADSKEDQPGRVRFLSRDDSAKDLLSGFEGRQRMNSFGGPARRVRTISTMDDEILMMMRQSSGESRRTNMYAMNKMTPIAVADSKLETGPARDVKAARDDSLPAEKEKNSMKRRNSTGTIYISQTMAQQDNTATIQCVCMVIRAHMVTAAKENIVPLPQYDVFKDAAFINAKRDSKETNPMALVPSLQTVKDFFTLVFSKSQLESDCIIMALIYCERLVKETKGRLCIRYDNWRSIVFACLVMASKVWDDLSMWNVDFSQVYPSFDLLRVNSLELSMLEALKYVIRVSASEYAKYYFHLRSMMVKLGLQQDGNFIRPLDINGARKLQLSTEKYEEMTVYNNHTRRRHHSMHEGRSALILERNLTENYNVVCALRSPVGLEQITHTEHMDADGTLRLGNKKGSQSNMTHK